VTVGVNVRVYVNVGVIVAVGVAVYDGAIAIVEPDTVETTVAVPVVTFSL
jgi:hypothetical protein